MSPRAAFIACLFLMVALIRRDVRRRPDVSAASWLVFAWAVIFASRPVSAWFQSGPALTTPDAYLEGSPIDRAVFMALIACGALVLAYRRVPIGTFVANNWGLLLFYGYCAVSVAWSDYPFVAFKRLFKDFGSVVMVLVLLTDENPVEAIRAVFIRCAYVLVPISFLLIRYYPEIGRAYTGFNANDLMYVGVATHKNTLGALLLVSSLFLGWDLISRPAARGDGPKALWIDSFVVLGMSLWLLRIANSATSLMCTVIGAAMFLAARSTFLKRRVGLLELYAVVAGSAWYVANSVVNVSDWILGLLGRDPTLTTRTDAWELLLDMGVNPVFGAGFKSFWAGDRMARVWRDFPGIVQAHNGYIETYLEGGYVGLVFLAVMMFCGLRIIKGGLRRDDPFGPMRLAFWVVALFYNFSEAAFTQLSLLWLVTLVVVIDMPEAVLQPAISATPVQRYAFGSSSARALRYGGNQATVAGGRRVVVRR